MIELKHVTKEYKIGEEVIKALDDITLDIQAGEFIAIMGVSGSGKSTLLNILGCMDRPSSGEYLLDGISVGLERPRAEPHTQSQGDLCLSTFRADGKIHGL